MLGPARLVGTSASAGGTGGPGLAYAISGTAIYYTGGGGGGAKDLGNNACLQTTAGSAVVGTEDSTPSEAQVSTGPVVEAVQAELS